MPGAGTNENTSQPGAATPNATVVAAASAAADANAATDDAFDFETLPDAVKKEFKKLRDENAKHRTKNKELDSKILGLDGTLTKLKTALGVEQEADPVKQLEAVKAQNEALSVEVEVGKLCRNHGIGSENEKYFRFLLAEKFESLKDGDEISDEEVAAIAQEAKKVAGRPANNSTGVNSSKPNPDSGKAGAVTVEAFAKMTTLEKSALYSKDPALYQTLFSTAMEKNLIK